MIYPVDSVRLALSSLGTNGARTFITKNGHGLLTISSVIPAPDQGRFPSSVFFTSPVFAPDHMDNRNA